MKPKKILQVMSDDYIGGVKSLTTMIGNGLAASGHRVETVYIKPTTGGTFCTLRNLLMIAVNILSGRYDVIFSYHGAASVYANVLGYISRTKIRAPHQTAGPKGIKRHWLLIDRWLGCAGVYTHIIINSHSAQRDFISWPKRYRDRCLLITHCVDRLPESIDVVDWRTRLRIPPDHFVMVTTGRLEVQKNHHVAVRALAMLPGVHLIIAGGGTLQHYLEEIARRDKTIDRLHLIGEFERSDIRSVLQAGDLYVFPSIFETFGIAVVEAAMLGLPILASDLPVLREVLDLAGSAGDAGSPVRFHDPSSPEAFVIQVNAFRAEPPTPECQTHFRNRICDIYSIEKMLSRYELFINS